MRAWVLSLASLLVIPNVVILLTVAYHPKSAAPPPTAEGDMPQITISGWEYEFDKKEYDLPPAGTRMRVVFLNNGDTRHNVALRGVENTDIELDLSQAGSLPKKLAMTAEDGAGQGLVNLPAEPGGIAMAEFTVGENTTFDVVCTLKGHETRGMLAEGVTGR